MLARGERQSRIAIGDAGRARRNRQPEARSSIPLRGVISSLRARLWLVPLLILLNWFPRAYAFQGSAHPGSAWLPQASGTHNQLNAIDITTHGQRAWAVGFKGTILATSDGGKRWVRQVSGTRNELNAVHFTAHGRYGWAVGFDGTILTSSIKG